MKLLKKAPLRVLLFSLLSMLAVAVTGTAQKQPQNVEVRIRRDIGEQSER